jgi:hypothetical protein
MSASSPTTLPSLYGEPIWVAWKNEARNGRAKKPPYDPKTGRLAASDDRRTWTTYDNAAQWAATNRAGVGVMLCQFGDLFLAGVDLDSCRDKATGQIVTWAQEIIDRLKSYSEVSPSGTGVKVFLTIAIDDLNAVEVLFDGKLGRSFKNGHGGDHPPAIEVYRGGRYFAVTNDSIGPTDELRRVSLADLQWLIKEAGPRFTGKSKRGNGQDKSRSAAAWRAGAMLRAGGASYDVMREALLNHEDPGLAQWARTKGLADGERELKRIFDRARSADEGGDKPVITISGGDLDRIATQGEEALLASHIQLFRRANELVRPVVSEVDAARERSTKIGVEPPYLRDILCRVAGWSKWNARARSFVAIDPPPEIAATILARAGEWKFPTIAGVISTPTMRPDGTILDSEGYDEATGLLLIAPPEMPPIPDAPSRDDALAALALLKSLLVEFPFVGDLDRAVALSALITPVVRGAFQVAPMHCAKAPVAGSGKSYLFDVAGAIAIGQIMPVMAAGANEEELEKRLGAALLAGQPLICIDNVNGELKGDALCQTIERPLVEIRILGKSERVRIETRATTTFCTGNNIIIVGDLCRRVITITLDPKMESPETREFESNPVELVLANRGRYVAAALTICRAYAVAGKPNKAKRLASFEGWSDTVRSALVWLEEPDVVASMAVVKTDDPELAELNEMLSSWADVLGVGYKYRLPSAEVIKVIGERQQESSFLSAWPRLNAAIQTVVSIGREPADAKRLGVWLRSQKGRIVGRYRFMNDADKNRMQASWWVDDLEGVETEGLRHGRSHSANHLLPDHPF